MQEIFMWYCVIGIVAWIVVSLIQFHENLQYPALFRDSLVSIIFANFLLLAIPVVNIITVGGFIIFYLTKE